MLIRNVNRFELEDALAKVNQKFGDNVQWNRLDLVGRTRQGGEKWQVTLRVKSSRGPGARLSAYKPWGNQRHLIAACWHAHGCFFDNLPESAEIVAMGKHIRPGDMWQDRNIGSEMYPTYYSEACEC